MKRLAGLVLAGSVLLALGADPAGANSSTISIDCDSVDVSWARFPERDVTLFVTVSQGGEETRAAVNTDSQPAGEASVPVDLQSGEVRAVVRWRLREWHQAGPVTTNLTCTPTTTTTPRTEPPTTSTTEPVTTSTGASSTSILATSVSPTTAPGLPDTGSGASLWALGVGAYFTLLGAAFMALNRRGTR